MPYSDDIAVLTSENVRLTYTPAGLGSRIIAFLADTILFGLVAIAITMFFMTAGMNMSGFLSSGGMRGLTLLFVIWIFTLPLLYWAYYFFFEWMNWGQTPGKQLLGLRVAMSDGAPADIVACAVRNVIRLVDVVFSFFGITIFIVVFTPKFQRLGDLAAGTVVIRTRKLHFDDILIAAQRAEREVKVKSVEAPVISARIRVTDAEKDVIKRYLERRNSLTAELRKKIAGDLAGRIRSRISSVESGELTDDQLLEAALHESENV